MNEKLSTTCSMVIYNNDEAIVTRAIDSFLDQKIENSFLCIIDNYMQDSRLLNVLENKYKEYNNIFIIKSMSNCGYGRGNNLGFQILNNITKMKKLSPGYHLVMNPDIFIFPNCIEKMTAFMDKNPNVGLLSPKILNPDGSIQKLNKESPTVFDMFIRRFLPGFIKNMKFFQNREKWYIRDDIGYEKISEVPFASGCFMFFRASIYQKIRGFDEDYFLYMEDADISRRASLVSNVLFYPDAKVTHQWSRATHRSIKHTVYAVKSAIIYFKKHGIKLW